MAATEWWDQHQCAEHWGVKPATWRAYVARQQAPQPARTRDPRTGNRRWKAAEVRAWPRPGRGVPR